MIVIGEEVERYRKMGNDLSVDAETVEMLVRKGITKVLGARPMKRTVQKYLGDLVRERMKNAHGEKGLPLSGRTPPESCPARGRGHSPARLTTRGRRLQRWIR